MKTAKQNEYCQFSMNDCPPLSLIPIICAVDKVCNVNYPQLCNQSHKREFADARRLYCFFAHRFGFNDREIGRWIDHTRRSVGQSIKTHQMLAQTDKDYASKAAQIALYLSNLRIAERGATKS